MELGLKINTEKSKIMVFRKGGFLGTYEQWLIDGNQLEVVNKYVYLGFTFTTSMSLQESVKQLVFGHIRCFKATQPIGTNGSQHLFQDI